MEQTRLILALTLSFLVLFVWNAFFVEPEPAPTQPVQQKEDSAVSTAKPADAAKPAAPLPEIPPETIERPAKKITVDTPFYTVQISEKGASFTHFVLKKYREAVEKDSPLKSLIPEEFSRTGTVLAGFTGGSVPNLDDAVFRTDLEGESLNVADAPKSLVFSWMSPQGIVFEKKFTFSPDTYLIGMAVTVQNHSAQAVSGDVVLALKDLAPEKVRYGFSGPSALINNSLEQIKIKGIEDKNTYQGDVGWVAMEGRYFLSAIVADEAVPARMQLALSGTEKQIVENKYIVSAGTIPADSQKSIGFDLYFGPKSLKLLKELNNGLSKAVNFGWFDFIAKPCLWVMNFIYDVIPNYGVAIIILTILTKVLLWPLGNKSYESMNQMKKIQPLMAEIREKYKNDKKKMNEELMALYKIYKVNPMGGCLPMLLQIPVFFALYRMLYEAIELRHAPFFGWINDLSAPDRLFHFGFSIPFMEPPYGIPVLTIIMGGTMLLQQKMSPPPGDPAQAKMMMFMPVVFTFIFINFSSGLVLYWLVNNVLSISQQYYIAKKNA